MRFIYFKVAIENCMNPMEVCKPTLTIYHSPPFLEIQLVHPTKRSSDFMIFVSRTTPQPNQMSAQYTFQCCNFKLYTLDNKQRFEERYMYFSILAYRNVKLRFQAILVKPSEFLQWQPPEERIQRRIVDEYGTYLNPFA